MRGSKGTHIAVPRERIGNHDALTLLSPVDGRVMFVLPAGAFAIVGTTDTFTTSSPDEVRATEADVAYLLATANEFFPRGDTHTPGRRRRVGRHSTVASVGGRHAGSGVARARGRREPRRTRLHHRRKIDDVSRDGRRRVARRVARRFGSENGSVSDAPLPGGDVQSFVELVAEISRETGDASLGEHLAGSYGSRWRDVWTEIDSSGRSRTACSMAGLTRSASFATALGTRWRARSATC